MKFDTNCDAHTWPEPQDGWCPICIMNESDDVKRQRDKLREALMPFANYACDEPCDCHNCKARDALKATEEG